MSWNRERIKEVKWKQMAQGREEPRWRINYKEVTDQKSGSATGAKDREE
jgi:hypothetical protein